MNRFVGWLLIFLFIGLLAWWWFGGDTPDEQPLALPPLQEPVREVEPEPLVRHPLPEPEAVIEDEEVAEPSPLAAALPETLPELDSSDELLFALTEFLIRNPQFAELLAPRDLVRRFVVTVDGLGSRAVPLDRLPVTLPGGRFLADEQDGRITISPRNYERYRHHIAFLDQLDSEDIVKAYVHLYPLFQQAWRDLGYPQGFFNDRLIEVIDQVLATPDIGDAVRLEQPSVWYMYQDPQIEALTAGQRLLVRMGPDNAGIVKRKLREIRAELVR